jgi:beta-galactosidase
VDPSDVEGWWYEGGGIYRHVWLNIADKVHVVPNSLYVHANLAEPGQTAPSGAEVDLESSVVNSTDQAMSGTFVSKIYDDRGKLVALSTSPIDAPAGESISVAQKINVENPRLWSLETPRCYRAEVSVKSGRHVLDNAKTEFGIRTIRYDANTGFYLNGKPVKIEGTCNHQDFPAVGIGMPDNLIWWRLKKLKEMGSNALRMSHNPPAAEMLEAADHLGMLVMDENRHLGDTYSDHTSSGTTYDDLSDLKDMILRDRNHPSIIMWSMCNEEWLQGSDEGAQIFTAMRDLVRKYDATRPVSCAMNGGWGSGISLVEDLVGFNYNPNVYDGYHRDHPSTPLFASETASRWTTRGVYKDDRDASTLSSYNFADDTWAPVAEKAFIAGSFVWTGFDYKGEPSPYSWPAVNSAFGILDMCGFPKDCFYYYKSWWQGSPVLHLMPHWNWKGQEGQDIRVVAYSNCDEVELFVNGKTVGRKSMPRNGHIEWDVPYQPGSIHAVGYNADKKIADEIVETTGEPAEIRLRSDMKTLDANNEDIAVVEASIVDSNGRVVPTANNLVTFRTSGVGHVAGVGNGDAGDHGWDKDSQRKAFNGYCAAIVGAETQSGTIEVTATAPGLKPAHFTINVNSPKK